MKASVGDPTTSSRPRRRDARSTRRRTAGRRTAASTLDLPLGEDVRAPGEAPGLLAIESAMDELAHALDIDPVELRIQNEPAVASRARRAVQRPPAGRVHARGRAAVRLGPAPEAPASVRDGRWLVGYGMAAAIRPHFQVATDGRASGSMPTARRSCAPT